MAAEREAPININDDILELIFSHVPLIHLFPASHVSNEWNRAVSASLAHLSPIKPWLMVLTTRASHVITTHAYDPRSHVWIEIKHAPSTSINNKPHPSPIRSSHSTLLFTLSPAEFAFSTDALHLEWHHAPAPRVWRVDPIVARVGEHVVVAGGACDFEDDPMAVEVYDTESRDWVTCESMPAMLKGSTSSTWVSVAVAGGAMHVTEKNSGVTFSFDPIARRWEGPYDLRADQSVNYCVTGTLGKQLMVAGLIGEPENVEGVKLWGVRGELGSGIMEEVGEMPKEMVWKLKGDSELGSVEVTWVGNFVYVRNTLEAEELIVCEVVDGNCCEWRSVRNAAVNSGTRMVVCGGDVCMEDLRRAALSKNRTFCLKHL